MTVNGDAKRTGGRHSELLEVTARIVARNGYTKTTLDEIASSLDMTRAAIYYYYSGKEALVASALGHFGEVSVGRLSAIACRSGDPRERLRELVSTHLQVAVVDAPEIAGLFLLRRDWPRSIQDVIMHWQQRHDRCFAQVIGEGIELGLFAADGERIARRMMHGALSACAEGLTVDTLTDAIQDVISARIMGLFEARSGLPRIAQEGLRR